MTLAALQLTKAAIQQQQRLLQMAQGGGQRSYFMYHVNIGNIGGFLVEPLESGKGNISRLPIMPEASLSTTGNCEEQHI